MQCFFLKKVTDRVISFAGNRNFTLVSGELLVNIHLVLHHVEDQELHVQKYMKGTKWYGFLRFEI